ncbi:MAG: circularly permuted type 2 ATP-grasp protein [Solirubrobacteraceae bacterium]
MPGDSWDELSAGPGRTRSPYLDLARWSTDVDLGRVARAVATHVERAGATFGGEDPWTFHVDPVPRIIATGEWADVDTGLRQRVRALDAFVADLHGPRDTIAAGIVPARIVEDSPWCEPDLVDAPSPAARIVVAGPDLIRDPDGRLLVLEDNLRTPSGLAYALAARSAVSAEVPPPDGLTDLREAIRTGLGAALRRLRPDPAGDGLVVLVSDGEANTAWYEHRTLADLLGIPLLCPDDLRCDGDRVRRREDGRPIDVVYRRTDEEALRDAEGRPTPWGELLLGPLRAGTIAVANAFGAGVADDKALYPYVDALVEDVLGEPPLLASIPTWDLGADEHRRRALERLDELVLKPRDGFGGHGVVLGPQVGRTRLAEIRDAITADPAHWIAQEPVDVSTHPTFVDGRLEPRHVDLRPFVVADGGADGWSVLPGALTRVALESGERIVNSSRGGGGKDTWVVDG